MVNLLIFWLGVYKLDELKKCIGVFSFKFRLYNEVKLL